MKKIISTILIGVLLLFTTIFLFGCSSGKPSDVSEQHYQYALKAIEIADSYLDYDISASEAYSQISNLYKRENELPYTEFGDSDHYKNFSIETDVLLLFCSIPTSSYHSTSDSYNDILKYRNELAETIGEKKR